MRFSQTLLIKHHLRSDSGETITRRRLYRIWRLDDPQPSKSLIENYKIVFRFLLKNTLKVWIYITAVQFTKPSLHEYISRSTISWSYYLFHPDIATNGKQKCSLCFNLECVFKKIWRDKDSLSLLQSIVNKITFIFDCVTVPVTHLSGGEMMLWQ